MTTPANPQPSSALGSGTHTPRPDFQTHEALIAWQSDEHVHPLTCGNDSSHRPLVPIIRDSGAAALLCPDCLYVQDVTDMPLMPLVRGHAAVPAPASGDEDIIVVGVSMRVKKIATLVYDDERETVTVERDRPPAPASEPRVDARWYPQVYRAKQIIDAALTAYQSRSHDPLHIVLDEAFRALPIVGPASEVCAAAEASESTPDAMFTDNEIKAIRAGVWALREDCCDLLAAELDAVAERASAMRSPVPAEPTPDARELREAFVSGAKFREVTMSLSGDGYISAEAERRYPSPDPGSPQVLRFDNWTCLACGAAHYGRSERCDKCWNPRMAVGRRPVCINCGTDILVRMDEFPDYFVRDVPRDLPTDHPRRCPKPIIYTTGESGHCHKPVGHGGPCSTHNDCGAEGPGGAICGKLPLHDGPHGWENEPAVSPVPAEAGEPRPTFLTIGGERVYCVGCKSWQPTEGFCEGDPDICPIGEEEGQGRSPTLAEAQEAIDQLAREMAEADDDAAQHFGTTVATLEAEIADLRRQLAEARADTERLDWLQANVSDVEGRFCAWHRPRGKIRPQPTLREFVDEHINAARSHPEEPTDGNV